jgi:glycosyltransferase involved in cell wall biosynthesis
MRILRAINSVDPAHGGPTESIKQVSAVHLRQGHDVEVVCLDPPDAPWLKDFPLPVTALGPGRTKYNYTPRFVPWLRTHRRDYDAVIINGIWQYNSFGTWQALHGTDTPYFVFPHGMLDPWFKEEYPLKHLKKWLYWPWAEYRVLRDAKAVFFTSEEERRLARESFWLYRCNEAVVNYGTAGPAGDSNAQRKLALSKFPRLEDARVLLFLGRIHPKKGCDILIKAFSEIVNPQSAAEQSESQTAGGRRWAQTDPALAGPAGRARRHSSIRNSQPLHLVFAGPDQIGWQSELMQLANRLDVADLITWTGMVSGDLKWGLLHLADAFILPSHQENFGIAVAEALSCGVPVLISKKINIWREIEQDQAGFASSDDAAGTRSLLERWLSLPETTRRAMKLNARRCFETRFEVEKAARSLIEEMEKCMALK